MNTIETGSALPNVTLYEFSLSHYNEKARWALDYKGIDYTSHPVLPGMHFGTIKKLSGQVETPVLQIGDEVVAGSANIVARVDKLSDYHPLFPSDPDEFTQVQNWIHWLDDEVGAPVRLALFADLFQDFGFASTFFSGNLSRAKQLMFRGAMYAIGPLMLKQVKCNPETAAQARELVDKALTRVASAVSSTGYLVGDSFTAADLTACALMHPLYVPPELRGHVPDRNHPVLKQWLDRWRAHEGRTYVEGTFAKHRLEFVANR